MHFWKLQVSFFDRKKGIKESFFNSAITGVTRKIISNLKPKVVLTRNKDGSYGFSSTTGLIKSFYGFKLNKKCCVISWKYYGSYSKR